MAGQHEGFALGVDLGTSNTVAVLRWPDGRTRPLLVDGQPILPSGVYADPDGGLHAGLDARRLAQADPARYEPNPKRRIDEPTVRLGDRDVAPAELLGAVLHVVGRAAVEAVGFLPPAVVTCPAAWDDSRRQVLGDALMRAGWPQAAEHTLSGPTPPGTRLLREPVAAARYYTEVLRRPVPVGGAIAVFDFGGGTLDVAVVRNEGADPWGDSGFTVISCGGLPDLGGLDVDAALVARVGELVADRHPQRWARLTAPADAVGRRDAIALWEAVRGAKELLSRGSVAPVAVPGVAEPVRLTREDVEHAARPLLERAVSAAREVIAEAGLTPDRLAGLFLVGGSSRIPLVARMLHADLGIAPTVLEQPELPVAEGALTDLPLRRRDASPYAVAAPAAPPGSPAAGAQQPPGAPAPGEAAPAAAPAPGTATRPEGVPAFAPGSAPVPAAAAGAPGPAATLLDAGVPGPGAGVTLPDAGTPGRTLVDAGPTLPGAPAPAGPPPSYPHVAPPHAPASAAPGSPAPAYGPASAAPASPGPAYAPAGPAPAYAPPHAPGGPRPAYPGARAGRRRAWWVALGAVVALAGVTTAAVLYLTRDRYPGLEFDSLTEVERPAAGDERPSGMWTAVLRDRAYLAFPGADRRLVVTAVEAGTGKRLWREPTGVTAADWDRLVAVPGAVVAFADAPGTSTPRDMVVLDGGSGTQRWSRPVRGDDEVYFTDRTAVLVDRTEKRVVGLDLRTGREAWSRPNPRDQYDGARTTVLPVHTDEAAAGPAYLDGGPRDPWQGEGRRLVQVGADRSVRVLDMDSGGIVGQRGNVADLDDLVVAHEDRLYVAADEGGYQLLAYDLTALSAEPVVLYRAPDERRRPKALVACGEHRACLLEVPDGKAEETTVVAAAEGKAAKSWGAPDATVLVPLGERLLVRTGDSSATSTLFDATGTPLLRDRRGVAARLDAGNLLVFDKPPSTFEDDRSLAGVWAENGEVAAELGQLPGVRSSSCSWNTRVIVCGAEKDFVIYRFAPD
ncbi:Hsp70 family protein [Micromonospora globbae]|uniref:Hsp70 family protein n=3 Tax=Micromonospora globbae TaxID=1894969 RepID=A0A420F822_9ACTN|nr:Hsp70 family protein [Micromonospora globbae]RKF29083.1 Hsp70 family protein [Micromonospora globbae]